MAGQVSQKIKMRKTGGSFPCYRHDEWGGFSHVGNEVDVANSGIDFRIIPGQHEEAGVGTAVPFDMGIGILPDLPCLGESGSVGETGNLGPVLVVFPDSSYLIGNGISRTNSWKFLILPFS